MMIRAERDGDEAAIAEVVSAAFARAPHASGREAAIVAALRAGGALALSLVAEESAAIVGHAVFSAVRVDGRDCGWFGLGPVSVQPGRQGEGVGGRLIRHGLDALRARGAGGCVVLGDPAYYGRFGFAASPALRYPGAPAEYFQCLAFGPVVPAGVVSYHAGFGA